ncbi:pentatricopeptide repeat-containing protein [Carex littledalei]|uniref:Pentatricopeptide repeat-containing protein n=1 Tax=Carex littledalei TaxID=544730 RepID=A0A833VMK4_9POAL|nr:pentatricopeptide repeat-containing protein [Carex littledalei]
MLQTMILKGLKPNVVCYNTYMKGLCNKGFIEKAEGVIQTMISKGLQPDEVSYNTLIKGLNINGKIEKAMEYQELLIQVQQSTNVCYCDGAWKEKLEGGIGYVIQEQVTKFFLLFLIYLHALRRLGFVDS